MKVIAVPRISGNFLRSTHRLRKKSPFLFWLQAPFSIMFIVLAWLICKPLWWAAWHAYALCAWIGFDLESWD